MTKDEIKVGDRINTSKGMGTVKCACGGYLTVMLDNGEWWVNMNAILPKEDKPTDEIQIGDRVKFKSKEELETMLEPSFWWGIPLIADKEATIIGMGEPYGYRVDIDPSLGGIRREFFDKLPKLQPNDHTIVIPVKADLDETYWDAYRAELASKIAVAYAEKGRYKPSEIGEFAVMVANDVVDNLKSRAND